MTLLVHLLLAFILSATSVLGAKPALSFVEVVSRAGISAPITPTPNDTNNAYWANVPAGFLLNEGKRQMYDDGRFLRRFYKDFLSPLANKDEGYFQSTDTIRGIQSALSLTAGLLPPVKGSDEVWLNPGLGNWWQPVPVHTIPERNDPFVSNFAIKNCPKAEQLFESFADTPAARRQIHKFLKVIREYYPNVPSDFRTLLKFINYDGNIKRALALNLTIDPKLVPLVEPLNEFATYFLSNMIEIPEIRRLAGGPVITQIMDKLGQFLNHKLPPSRKLQYFSSHGTPMRFLLATLNHTVKSIPYGALVAFELYQNVETDAASNFVQLKFKPDVNAKGFEVLRFTPCPNQDLCPFGLVQKATSPLFIRNTQVACTALFFFDEWEIEDEMNIIYK